MRADCQRARGGHRNRAARPSPRQKPMPPKPRLRSQLWFDNPDNPGMTALYLERYLNYGLTKDELCAGKPIIGIAQTGSDLAPCNPHHIALAKPLRDGIPHPAAVASPPPPP